VRVKLSGRGDERTLQVMAEDPATGQLVVDQCMALSRRISDRIDAIEEAGEELVHGAYNLEVSSPGIDRPADPGRRTMPSGPGTTSTSRCSEPAAITASCAASCSAFAARPSRSKTARPAASRCRWRRFTRRSWS
jgi:hypothetical protein